MSDKNFMSYDNAEEVLTPFAAAIKSTFVGTQAEWDALTAEQKATYRLVNITDDGESGDVVDAVTNGDMHPVTSNAVYDEINSTKERLVTTIPSNTYATYSEAFAALKVIYDELTDTEKRNAYLVTNDARIYNNTITAGYFVTFNSWAARNEIAFYGIYLPNLSIVDFHITGTDGVSVIDQASNAQTAKIALYIRAH